MIETVLDIFILSGVVSLICIVIALFVWGIMFEEPNSPPVLTDNTTMRCIDCGNEMNNTDWSFCPKCSEKVQPYYDFRRKNKG